MIQQSPQTRHTSTHRRWPALLLLLGLWLAIFFASLWTPPLLDDADATHAQAAQSMARTGDWVTLHVDGVRYLEKAPLPYWLAAISLRIFGANSFAIHLPLALAVLALALLSNLWSRKVFDERTAFYTALFTLTTAGIFLFTRIFIPEVLLSLFLDIALYCMMELFHHPPITLSSRPKPADFPSTTLSSRPKQADFPSTTLSSRPKQADFPSTTLSSRPKQDGFIVLRSGETPVFANARSSTDSRAAYFFWIAAALATLTKGLVAIVFLLATTLLYLALTRSFSQWRRFRPLTGLAIFLATAAPWHILAGIRNTNREHGHGFFWFYFINEHVLRFLGRRTPRDYNKLPAALYWSLHLVWLFPWSIFAPAAIVEAWRNRRRLAAPHTATQHTVLFLSIYSAFVLLFFSLSTNQEYYTFPVYLPLLMLLAVALARAERDATLQPALTFAHASFTVVGAVIAALLGYGLWTSRQLPFQPDIGAALAHRDIGQYTLSMSHFFDLTASSFAALRLPAAIAAAAFALGPAIAWMLRARKQHVASTITIALTSAAFLLAAHIALARFAPLLSSRDFADRILALEQTGQIAPSTEVLLYGDQAFGSSVPFYLDRPVRLVDARTTSMYFGSTFPDTPPVFLTHEKLLANWGSGPRKILFVPLEKRAEVAALLGPHSFVLAETSGKQLLTDRSLDAAH